MDLIAGLPNETYDIFRESFDQVYNTNCDVIHLGFLKVLHGSQMESDAKLYGIVCRDYPPYEILRNSSISYYELSKLKRIEQLVDTYKNSGNFAYSLRYAVSLFDEPFDFFESYCDYLDTRDYFGRPHKFTYYYDAVYEFLSSVDRVDKYYLKDILLHDYAMNSKPRQYPECFGQVMTDYKKEQARKIFNNPEMVSRHLSEYSHMTPSTISRQCNIEIFDYDIDRGVKLGEPRLMLYSMVEEKLSV